MLGVQIGQARADKKENGPKVEWEYYISKKVLLDHQDWSHIILGQNINRYDLQKLLLGYLFLSDNFDLLSQQNNFLFDS